MPSADLTGQLVFLGTGTSHGVPVIGCDCAVCASDDPRDRRLRCSVAVGLPGGTLLIDSPPDLRTQLLREGIGVVHAVAYTHAHVDHLFGLDDLRIMSPYLGHDLPVYCKRDVQARIRDAFAYAFDPETLLWPAGGVPRLEFRDIDLEPFHVLGATVTPIPMLHGGADVRGYRIGDLAYCTDVSAIEPEGMRRLAGLRVLILDALRLRPHPTHFTVDQAIEVVRQLRPEMTYFTHIAHELGHAATEARLPAKIRLAYDGLRIEL